MIDEDDDVVPRKHTKELDKKLHQALAQDTPDQANSLIEFFKDPEITLPQEALHTALRKNWVDLVSAILSRKDQNAVMNQPVTLQTYTQRSRPIPQVGPSFTGIDTTCDTEITTPIFWSVYHRNEEALIGLLDRGVFLTHSDAHRLLEDAIERKKPRIVYSLLKRFPELSHSLYGPDRNQSLYLVLAKKGWSEALEALQPWGPVYFKVFKNTCTEQDLRGLNPCAFEDQTGETLISLAQKRNKPEMIALLEPYFIKPVIVAKPVVAAEPVNSVVPAAPVGTAYMRLHRYATGVQNRLLNVPRGEMDHRTLNKINQLTIGLENETNEQKSEEAIIKGLKMHRSVFSEIYGWFGGPPPESYKNSLCLNNEHQTKTTNKASGKTGP